MTRADLIALAERVEKAKGADRQIDAEIVWRITPGIVGIERGPLDGEEDYLFEWWPRRPWTASWLEVPAFTASLDAALTLVPEGMCWSVTRKESGLHVACVWRGSAFCCKACATPAPALTAAALRARAEETPHD